MSGTIKNETITLLVSACFGRETNMMRIAKTVLTKFGVGEKFRNMNVRGYVFERKKPDCLHPAIPLASAPDQNLYISTMETTMNHRKIRRLH